MKRKKAKKKEKLKKKQQRNFKNINTKIKEIKKQQK